MKSVLLFTAFLIFSVHLSLQIPKLVNCPPDFGNDDASMANVCAVFTCKGPDSFHELICAEWICQPGKQIGYEEVNNSKVYPECCGGPICAD